MGLGRLENRLKFRIKPLVSGIREGFAARLAAGVPRRGAGRSAPFTRSECHERLAVFNEARRDDAATLPVST
jgi:hypothetical protein